MPRLVRRAPLKDRLLSSLNPLDIWLNLATAFEGYDYDGLQKSVGMPVGLILNLACLFARANSGLRHYIDESDVIYRPGSGRGGGRSGFGNFCYLLSWVMLLGSIVNAVYCVFRKKRYRLFEQNINLEPQTPSARRVAVDSSPAGTSFTFFSSISDLFSAPSMPISPSSRTDTVWELAIWDPAPLSLCLLNYFSPVHASLYFLTLPLNTTSTTASPMTTYFTLLTTITGLTLLMNLTTSLFQQQQKDRSLLHKEVMHEYDAKYVAPRLNVLRRDVAVSTDDGGTAEAYTPETRTGFKIRPNKQYEGWTDMQSPIRDRSSFAGESSLRRSSLAASLMSPPQPTNLFAQNAASSLARRAVSNSHSQTQPHRDHRDYRDEYTSTTTDSPPLNRKLRFPVTPRRSTSPQKRVVSEYAGERGGMGGLRDLSYTSGSRESYGGGSLREREINRRDSVVGGSLRGESPRKRLF